jgi:hypothetical protein
MTIKSLLIINILLLIAFSALALELIPVAVAHNVEIAPPSGASVDSPDSNIIEASRARRIITFDFPDGYFGEDNVIMEAVLKVEIEPSVGGAEMASSGRFEAICVPLTRTPGDSPGWAGLHSAYNMDYAEFSVYDEEGGFLFFEIARMLYAANDGEIDLRGVMIIPAKGSRPFEIADVASPIDFRTANMIGARATE